MKKFKKFILESESKELIFTFGRFQPPTIGHEKLFNFLAQLSKERDAKFEIYPSHTQDKKTNPLFHVDKVQILRKMFPKYARHIISDATAKTVLNVAANAYQSGYTKLTLVVGEDRVQEFNRLLNTYNNHGSKEDLKFYNFKDGIDVISAGNRDPDSFDDVESMSASKLRQAAIDGDFKTFSQGMPKNFDEKLKVFNLIRTGLKLHSIYAFREHIDLTNNEVRNLYLTDKIFLKNEKIRVKATGEETRISERKNNFILAENNQKYWLHDIESI